MSSRRRLKEKPSGLKEAKPKTHLDLRKEKAHKAPDDHGGRELHNLK